MDDIAVIRTDTINKYKSGDEFRKGKCPYCKKINYVTHYGKNHNGDMCRHAVEVDRYHITFHKDPAKPKKRKECIQPGLFGGT